MNDIQKHLATVEGIDAEISALQATIADKLQELALKRDAANEVLEAEIMKEANAQLSQKDYGCGTANIEIGNTKIKIEVRKKVKWDQDKLQIVKSQILAANKNPADYLKEELKVSETKYDNFPDDIRAVFEPARTVEPAKPMIKYERKV